MGQISTPTTEPPPSRPPPPLPDDLVEEVLLRFPPDDPASLLRAALVCKPWCRLLSGRGFRRRFAQFHRTPPTLGFVCSLGGDEDRDRTCEEFAEFVPTSSFRPPRALSREWRAVDSRHGRILLHTERWELESCIGDAFAIWDPISGELRELPILKYKGRLSWRAAVLCAGGDACDHIDCNQGPFQVVIVAADFKHIHACIYSSEVGAWSMLTERLHHPDGYLHFAVSRAPVENVLYFAFGICANILKYNLVTQEMSVINAPASFRGKSSIRTTMEGGHLGIAMVLFSYLCLWTREVGPEGDAGWTWCRVIELEKLLPIGALSTSPRVVGADGPGVFFLLTVTGDVLYTIDIKTSQVKKVCKVSNSSTAFPYMSFYTPSTGSTSTGEGPKADAVSSA